MRITFRKCNNSNFYDPDFYDPEWYGVCTAGSCAPACFDYTDNVIIRQLLTHTFKSIGFKADTLYGEKILSCFILFDFKEQSDEAMFLLWSSDGVDVEC